MRTGIRDGAPLVEANGAPVAGLMLATPCYGGLCHDAYLQGVWQTAGALGAQGVPFQVVTLRNESLIQRARNVCLAHFLASDCSHLLFVDADIGFTPRAVLRLLAHRKHVVAGTYRKKTLDRADWVVVEEPGPRVWDAAGAAFEARALGTGFLMLSRDAVMRMVGAYGRETHFRLADGEGAPGAWRDNLFALFDCWVDPETRGYWSEDYGFCRRWASLGGKLWCDPWIELEHWGTACFAGSPIDSFGAQETAHG